MSVRRSPRAVAGVDYVQESVFERTDVKRSVYEALDPLLGDAATVVGSSSSGIPASEFTGGLRISPRCLVAHPVNPPHLVPVVELVPAPWTALETVDAAHALMLGVGQYPIRIARELRGFILNRLQGVLLREAWALYEEGYCSAADIDATISKGLGYRWSFMGPFETIDLNAPGGIADYAARLGGALPRHPPRAGRPAAVEPRARREGRSGAPRRAAAVRARGSLGVARPQADGARRTQAEGRGVSADHAPTPARAPDFGLTGRRALVTGASRGLGRAIAEAFAGAGAAVTLCARTDEARVAAAALTEAGFTADALVADVTDAAAVAAALDTREGYDILVNNAGTNRPKPQLDVTAADYDAVMDLNLRAAFFVTQAVTRRMLAERRHGSVINMSSQMGHVGAANRTLYCASKWALEGFTKALAVELGPHGIRVNTICPTFIETPMTAQYFENAAFRAEVLGKIKLGRLGRIDEVTGAAVFLASDASSLMTGSALMLDGGWTAD